jgi:shikimate dehydrogenase
VKVTPSTVISEGAQRFLDAEVESPGAQGNIPLLAKLAGVRPGPEHDGQPANDGQPVNIAAIGTTAARAVHGELLSQAITARGYHLGAKTALSSPDELFDEPAWQLGVVLSPWKRDVGARCDALAPSALSTGVVDTVLRSSFGTIGFNTNTWSAMSALEVLAGEAEPRSLLMLGAGASARSVALAVGRRWPGCAVVIAARSRRPAEDLAQSCGGQLLEDLGGGAPAQGAWDVVVNTTTWGETDSSEAEPFGIHLEGVFQPGGRLFDLNNRISALQHQALTAGCAVVSGSVMQRVTNASRAGLLPYAGPPPQCN